jgi:DNA-binding NarL/FixJ family response regulator
MSEYEKGSVFTISFKRCIQSDENERSSPLFITRPCPAKPVEVVSPVPRPKNGRATVFVVEDNPDMLSFLKSHIGRRYNVSSAVNGQAALKLLQTIPHPHLILSDIMMNGMDGYELLQKVSTQKTLQSIPFVFLTAKTTTYHELKGLQGGAVDYITKPFTIDVLMAKIDSLIRNQEKLKAAALNEMGFYLYAFLTTGAPVETLDRVPVREREPVLQKKRNERSQGSQEIVSSRTDMSGILPKLESEFGISQREMEVIRLMKEGFLYKEIADELNISQHTVETYRKRIFKKCKINNKVELIGIFNQPCDLEG